LDGYGRTPSLPDQPFEIGDAKAWWKARPSVGLGPIYDVEPLVNLVKVKDWLGDVLLITPPDELHWLCKPQVSEFGDALIWRDEHNEPILALRSWTIKRSQYDNEPDEIRGQDLILRPDILEKLKEVFRCNFTDFTMVSPM